MSDPRAYAEAAVQVVDLVTGLAAARNANRKAAQELAAGNAEAHSRLILALGVPSGISTARGASARKARRRDVPRYRIKNGLYLVCYDWQLLGSKGAVARWLEDLAEGRHSEAIMWLMMHSVIGRQLQEAP